MPPNTTQHAQALRAKKKEDKKVEEAARRSPHTVGQWVLFRCLHLHEQETREESCKKGIDGGGPSRGT